MMQGIFLLAIQNLVCFEDIYLFTIKLDSQTQFLCVCVCVCVCVCDIFFFYSSVNRHLQCSHVLVIVNNASVNMGVYIFEILIPIISDITEVGILNHRVTLFSLFQELSSIVAASFCSPTRNTRVSQFPHVLIDACDFFL